MALDCSLEYQKFDDGNKYQGRVKDLSATGVSFLIDERMPLGVSLHIKLTPVNDITPPMSAEVRITRCDKHLDGDYHVAGEITRIV